MIKTYVPALREKYAIDLVIANAENATHGKGLIKKHYQELIDSGVDLLTMGNHTYAKRELFSYIDEADRLIVPYNKARALPGVGSRVITVNDQKVRVTNMLGVVFMDGHVQNPFEAIVEVLEEDEADLHIVDFHAEATSEKVAFGYFLDGRVSAVLGSHTHVATADERILPKGTFYQSDVGMTGPYESVIGLNVDTIVERNVKGIMTPFIMAEGAGQLNATLMTFDQGKPVEIERIIIDPSNPFE